MSNPNDNLSPREPFVDQKGLITRSWWRKLNELFQQTGTTANPLVVQESVIQTGGVFSDGGTIVTPNIPAETLLGNPANESTQPTTIAIDPSLSFNGDTLGVTPIAPGTLFGNPGSVVASAVQVAVGTGLTLDPVNGLQATGATSGDTTLEYLIPDRSGQVFDASRLASDALAAALLKPAPVTSNTMLLTGSIINSGMVTFVGTDVTISGDGRTITFGVGTILSGKTLASPIITTPTIYGMTESVPSPYVASVMAVSQVVIEQIIPYPFTIPTTLSSHFMLAGTTATANANFTLNVISQANSVTAVGTLQVAAGARILNTGAGTITAAGTYAAGTAVQLVAPNPADATLAGFTAVLGIKRQT